MAAKGALTVARRVAKYVCQHSLFREPNCIQSVKFFAAAELNGPVPFCSPDVCLVASTVRRTKLEVTWGNNDRE